MRKTLLLALVAALAAGTSLAEEVRIPVYPGSLLSIDEEQGSDPQCCDFTTPAPFAGVVEYYEKALKAESLSVDEVAARYPALAEQVKALKAQLAPGIQFRVIPHSPVLIPGQKEPVPNLFELLSVKGEVRYTIDQEMLDPAGEPYAADFRKRTGKLNLAEERQRDQEEMDAQFADQLKKEAEIWAKTAEANGVPLYPDALYEDSEGPTLSASGTDAQSLLPLILAVFKSKDPYDKVRAFYASKLSAITMETMLKRKGVDKFLAGSEYTGRAYTSKKRFDIPRDFFIGKGCVDVAVEEGPGDEKGAKETAIILDLDPKCKGAEAMKKLLWPEE